MSQLGITDPEDMHQHSKISPFQNTESKMVEAVNNSISRSRPLSATKHEQSYRSLYDCLESLNELKRKATRESRIERPLPPLQSETVIGHNFIDLPFQTDVSHSFTILY
jgi:hypothetical protein